MFGRNTRTSYHPSIFGMFHHGCEIEIGSTFQLWIDTSKISLVAIEKIALPQMCTEPTCAVRPDAPCGTIDHSSRAPYICVMMSHISTGAIHLLCSLHSCDT